MTYFAQSSLDAIKANPNFIVNLWNGSGAAFKQSLGSGFAAETDEHIKLMFCGMVAFDMFPYGASTSATLEDLLAEDVIDCDNYAALMLHLFKILQPVQTTTLRIVGWDGGYIGNHCQVFFEKAADVWGRNGGYGLIDPTHALFYCGFHFDWLTQGKRVPPSQYRSIKLNWRLEPALNWQRGRIIDAVAYGYYKPSDLMYHYPDVESFIAGGNFRQYWATPRA
jgi:hypothetical protein